MNLRIDTELLSRAKHKVKDDKRKGDKETVTNLIETSLDKQLKEHGY